MAQIVAGTVWLRRKGKVEAFKALHASHLAPLLAYEP